VIDDHDNQRAVLDASRRLLVDLYQVAEPNGLTDHAERLHTLLSRPGVTSGRDPAGLALVLVEGLSVLADAVIHRPTTPIKVTKPRLRAPRVR